MWILETTAKQYSDLLLFPEWNLTYKDFWNLVNTSPQSCHQAIKIAANPDLEFFTILFKGILSNHQIFIFNQDDLAQRPVIPPVESVKSTLGKIYFKTSGSTDQAKWVQHSFWSIYYSALSYQEYFKTKESQVTYIALPLHHVAGLMSFFRAFFSGGQVFFGHYSQLDTILKKQIIDHLSLVPAQIFSLLNNSHFKWNHINCLLIGGQSLSPQIKKTLIDHQISYHESYANTECMATIAINGEILPYHQIDQNHFKGPTVCEGYWQDNVFFPTPEKGFPTSDEIQIHNQKIVSVTRKSLEFKSGGEWVRPQEFTSIIESHFAFGQLHYLPFHDDQFGQIPLMFAKFNQDTNFIDLKVIIEKNFSRPYWPKHIIPLPELTDSIKWPKQKLIEMGEDILKRRNEIDYELLGSPKKKLMIFLHGNFGSYHDLFMLAEHFSQKFFCLLISLPGFGKSKIQFQNHQSEILRLHHFIQSFGDSTPIIYGYSLGGRVALELANQFKNYTQLILESAHPGIVDTQEKMTRQTYDQTLLSHVENPSQLKIFLKEWYQQPMWNRFLSEDENEIYIDEKIKMLNLSELKKAQVIFSSGFIPSRRLAFNQKMKIIYLCGNQDKKYCELAEAYQSADQQTLIFNEGHNIHHRLHQEIFDKIMQLWPDL